MEMDTSDTPVSPTDEELRKLLKPNPSRDEVVKAIESSYGLSNIHIVKELESYDDRNYLVRHGESLFLVKIHNGVESAQFLRSNIPLQELLSASLSETTSGGTDVSKTAPSPPQRDAGVSSFKVHLTVSPVSSQASKGNPFEKTYLGSTEYAKVVLSLPEREKGVSSIDLQNAIFQKLKEPKYNIKSSVPIPVVSKDLSDHSYIATYSFPVISSKYSPCRLAMRLLHWVEGDPMSSCIPISIETLSQAGVYLGNLCHALDDLTRENHLAVQSSTRYHAWDGKNTLDLEKFTDCIQDPQRRSLVTSVIEAFREEMGTETQQLFRCGILHGDFNDANIILNGKGRVDGVIDFGDSTNSWRVFDVTIAMAYAMLSTYGKGGRSLSAAAAILRGFNSVYPLLENEIKYLRLFVAARLSCSVSIGAYSYQQNPENKYLLFHSEPAWKALELIWTGGKDGHMAKVTDNLFRIACENKGTLGDDPSLLICTDISFPDPHIPDIMKEIRFVI